MWSRAEQVVDVAPLGPDAPFACRVQVVNAVTGQPLRAARVSVTDSDDTLRRAVCDALGETCEAKPHGIPWYVWPIAGVAVVGGVVSAVFIVNANRQYRYVSCPPGMVCQ